MFLERLQKWGKAVGSAAFASFGVTLAVAAVLTLWHLRGAPGEMLATIKAFRQAADRFTELVTEIKKDYKDGDKGIYWKIDAGLDAYVKSSKNAEDLTADLRVALMGGKDSRGIVHAGVFPEFTALLGDARGLVADLRTDVNRLTDSTDETLKPLKSTLESIDQLTKTLDEQVRTLSPKAYETLGKLNASIEDLDKLLADPNVAKTLAHVEGTSEHFEESAKSVDEALRPWRKKAGQLKWIVEKLFGLIKLTFPVM